MKDVDLQKRVDDCLASDKSSKFIESNIQNIYSNSKDVDASLIQSTRTLFLLILGFELLRTASISEASIGGMKLTDLTLVIKIFPAAVAYMIYWISSLWMLRILLKKTT